MLKLHSPTTGPIVDIRLVHRPGVEYGPRNSDDSHSLVKAGRQVADELIDLRLLRAHKNNVAIPGLIPERDCDLMCEPVSEPLENDTHIRRLRKSCHPFWPVGLRNPRSVKQDMPD